MLESERLTLDEFEKLGGPIPDLNAMIEEMLVRNGTRDRIKSMPDRCFLKAHPDPFDIREGISIDDAPVIDAEFTVIDEEPSTAIELYSGNAS